MTPVQRVIFAVLLWLSVIALAALFDSRVAAAARDVGTDSFLRSHKIIRETIKLPGEYLFTACVAVIVLLTHPLRWRAAGFVLLATAVSGVNGLMKWTVGRLRPYKIGTPPRLAPFELSPFIGGFRGLFGTPNICFPSGHAALAFATAAAVAMLWPQPRWRGLRWGGYAIAAVVAAERVAENAHWLSDAVAAAALGVAGVYLIHWIVTKFVDDRSEDARSVGSRLLA